MSSTAPPAPTMAQLAHGHGHGLIELLIVLAIAAVLGAAALPGFKTLQAGSRARTSVNQLIAQVQFARQAAVTLRRTVTLCPSVDGRHCGGAWQAGALAFADDNSNGRRDANEAVVKRFAALPAGSRVAWRAFGNRNYLRFRATGMTGWQNGHFQYCPADGNPRHARQVIINVAGRARLAPDRDGDGIVEDARGRAVDCDG